MRVATVFLSTIEKVFAKLLRIGRRYGPVQTGKALSAVVFSETSRVIVKIS